MITTKSFQRVFKRSFQKMQSPKPFALIVSTLPQKEDERIEEATGRIDEIRIQKGRTFIKIRKIQEFEPKCPSFESDFQVSVVIDHSSFEEATVQCEQEDYDTMKLSEFLKKCCVGTPLTITGIVQKHPKRDTFEIHARKIEMVSTCPPDVMDKMPFAPTPKIRRGLETRPLFLHSMTGAMILRLWSKLAQSFRRTFEDKGAIELVKPAMFVASSCEGGATLFKVPYPGLEKAYLTQSSQFYLEDIVSSVGHVFCFASSFRAEESHTRRHECVFEHLEAEIPLIADTASLVHYLEYLWRTFIQHFLVFAERELKELGVYEDVVKRSQMESIVMTHEEAILKCRELGIYFDPEHKTHFEFGDDIPEMQERAMTDHIGKVIYLTKFPKKIKSFYMADDGKGSIDDGKGSLDIEYTMSCDVLFPGVGEIIGSGVRESDPKVLKQKILDQGLDPKDYTSLLFTREYGHLKTAGFGLGSERFLAWLIGDIFDAAESAYLEKHPEKAVPQSDRFDALDSRQTGISIVDISPFPATPGKIH